MAFKNPEQAAYDIKHQPGFTATIEREVLHILQCKLVQLTFRTEYKRERVNRRMISPPVHSVLSAIVGNDLIYLYRYPYQCLPLRIVTHCRYIVDLWLLVSTAKY